jgi:hypothetical protein
MNEDPNLLAFSHRSDPRMEFMSTCKRNVLRQPLKDEVLRAN